MSRREWHRPTIWLGAVVLGFCGPQMLNAAVDEEASQRRTDLLLESIQSELQLVRDENNQMKEEIDLLRAESSDDWMTEQRAEQIRGLVADVLSDADTRANLNGTGLMAGWSDGFFLSSADGRFLLNIGGLSQTRFMLNWRRPNSRTGPTAVANPDRWVYGFESTTNRLNLSGHLFGKDLSYRFEFGHGRLDPNGYSDNDNFFGARVYEAWVRQRLTDQLALKVGVFRAPFTRETLVYEGRQLMVDRSSVDYRMGMGRVTGVELDYVDDEFRAMLSVNSGSGALFSALNRVQRQPPHSYITDGSDYSIQARAEFLLAGEWEQFRQFTSPPGQEFAMMVGIAGTAYRGEDDNAKPNPFTGRGTDIVRYVGGTADISLMFGGANLFAAFIYENQHDIGPSLPGTEWMAVVVQGGVYIDAKTELIARYQWGGPYNTSATSNNAAAALGSPYHILQVGFNYYFDGQDVKFTLDAGVSFSEMNGVMAMSQTGWIVGNDKHHAQFLLRAQLQLMF
jgi:hypothetical protein